MDAEAARRATHAPRRIRCGTAAVSLLLLAVALQAASTRVGAQPEQPAQSLHSAQDPPSARAAHRATPAGPQSARGAGAGEATHQWRDGRQRRTLVIDETLEADFSGDRPVLRPQLGPAPRRPPAGPAAPPGRADAQGPAAPASHSPVFRDEAGQPRALPGGVIVVLHAPIGDAAARALIESLGARPLKPIGLTMWLVDSPPGVAALELAERLADSGRFAAVEPNWWVPRARR